MEMRKVAMKILTASILTTSALCAFLALGCSNGSTASGTQSGPQNPEFTQRGMNAPLIVRVRGPEPVPAGGDIKVDVEDCDIRRFAGFEGAERACSPDYARGCLGRHAECFFGRRAEQFNGVFHRHIQRQHAARHRSVRDGTNAVFHIHFESPDVVFPVRHACGVNGVGDEGHAVCGFKGERYFRRIDVDVFAVEYQFDSHCRVGESGERAAGFALVERADGVE